MEAVSLNGNASIEYAAQQVRTSRLHSKSAQVAVITLMSWLGGRDSHSTYPAFIP